MLNGDEYVILKERDGNAGIYKCIHCFLVVDEPNISFCMYSFKLSKTALEEGLFF
jgi:hypothetical protein